MFCLIRLTKLVLAHRRMDCLTGLFAAGCAPTATSDPFALRRSAVGLLSTLLRHEMPADLPSLVRLFAGSLPIPVADGTVDEICAFLSRQGGVACACLACFVRNKAYYPREMRPSAHRRLEQQLLEEGWAPEAVRAAIAARGADPALAARTARELVVSKNWMGQTVAVIHELERHHNRCSLPRALHGRTAHHSSALPPTCRKWERTARRAVWAR